MGFIVWLDFIILSVDLMPLNFTVTVSTQHVSHVIFLCRCVNDLIYSTEPISQKPVYDTWFHSTVIYLIMPRSFLLPDKIPGSSFMLLFTVVNIHEAAVIWLKYCRYGVKHYQINKSTSMNACMFSGSFALSVKDISRKLYILWEKELIEARRDVQFEAFILLKTLFSLC